MILGGDTFLLSSKISFTSKMGRVLLALISLFLGATAQTTAGAYGQCKTSVSLSEAPLTDFFEVEEAATRAQLLAGPDTRVLPISEGLQVDG